MNTCGNRIAPAVARPGGGVRDGPAGCCPCATLPTVLVLLHVATLPAAGPVPAAHALGLHVRAAPVRATPAGCALVARVSPALQAADHVAATVDVDRRRIWVPDVASSGVSDLN